MINLNKPDIIKAYDLYLKSNDVTKQMTRASQSGNRMSASSAGSCAKKQWYDRNHPNLREPFKTETLRIFQVGNLIGDDLDAAMNMNLLDFPNKYAEEYITNDDYNLGGSFDLLIVKDNKGYLYDYKTANTWAWTKQFGKKRAIDSTSGDQYRFQLGTYAWLLSQDKYKEKYEYEEIVYMALIGYNKNDSKINEVEVPMNFVDFAKRYWDEAKIVVDSTQEPEQSKTVPFMSWECKSYCSYSKICNNPVNPNYEGAS